MEDPEIDVNKDNFPKLGVELKSDIDRFSKEWEKFAKGEYNRSQEQAKVHLRSTIFTRYTTWIHGWLAEDAHNAILEAAKKDKENAQVLTWENGDDWKDAFVSILFDKFLKRFYSKSNQSQNLEEKLTKAFRPLIKAQLRKMNG